MSEELNNNSYLCVGNNDKTMALNIGNVMALKNVTQKELSEKTGITQANISRIVTGKAQPNNATLAKIADALGVEMYEMYDAPEVQSIKCPHCGRTIYISKNNPNIGGDNHK